MSNPHKYILKKLIEHAEDEKGLLYKTLGVFGRVAGLNYLVLTSRALIHSLHSRHDKAIGDLNQAIALDPSNADFYIDRGRAWLSLNEHKRAIDDFTGAIRLNPDSQAYLERGDVYTRMREYDKAIEDYERAVTLSPDAKAYAARGALYHLSNRLSDAMNDFDNATMLDDSDPIGYVQRGSVYQQQGNYKKAIDEYTKAIGLIPELFDSNRDMLDLLNGTIQSRLYEEAIAIVAGIQAGRGLCFLFLGDSDKSLADLDAAIHLTPGNADLYCARGSAYVNLGNHAKAMKDVKTALELDTTNVDALFVKAASHFNTEDFHSAIASCETAIALSPNRSELHCVRGRSRLHMGDYADAIADFDKAIELEPDDDVSQRLGIGESLIILKLDTGDSYAGRGLAYSLLGNETAAKEDFGRAKELGYRQAEIEEELAELQSAKRESTADQAPGTVPGNRKEVASPSQVPSSTSPTSDRSARSKVGRLSAMTKEEYVDLLRTMGFHSIEVGKTLKHRRTIPSLYFNCRYGQVSFVGYRRDEHRYDADLWSQMPAQKKKDDNPRLITIVPRRGRERDAFVELLS